MNYAPEGMYLWDPWFVETGDGIHMFHLQSERDGKPADRHHNRVSIGHAVSEDLRRWTGLGPALAPDPPPAWDSLSLWTGSVLKSDEGYRMLYTGRSRDQFWVQRIGLATSADLVDWVKEPSNPVLSAFGGYYQTDGELNALGVAPAWRDPFLFQDPDSGSYLAAVTARAAGSSREFNGCIALAESRDFVDWTVLPPLVAPNRYDEMEVPQLVAHEGSYYLFFQTQARLYSPEWAQRAGGAATGLHCYRSAGLRGPYAPVNGNGVVMDGEQVLGWRLVRQGEGYVLVGWQNTGPTGEFVGRVGDPVPVTIEGDRIAVGGRHPG